ncbi:Amino-acid acetyltransferase, mitochondrial [Zancudomyces culisetae]|uniref:Amino-acid acetyltransferase, mitochondrial n=1 Tax=Zancudomyces culisetae TaxID=1213189 RepID=A0A1R1PPI3_ZANCU|nr:Amino-acid acetyltransferase, mitochondrial [Zancudomyces culisetae]|eukprot:OMH82813.1 Amino-acid acetyltransferase, mitochondrial [Zancudomyces culisetae]
MKELVSSNLGKSELKSLVKQIHSSQAILAEKLKYVTTHKTHQKMATEAQDESVVGYKKPQLEEKNVALSVSRVVAQVFKENSSSPILIYTELGTERDKFEKIGRTIGFMHRVGIAAVVFVATKPGLSGQETKDMTECLYKLVEKIENAGGEAQPITHGVFKATVDPGQNGDTATILDISTESIKNCLARGIVPIVLTAGTTHDLKYTTFDGTEAFLSVIKHFQDPATSKQINDVGNTAGESSSRYLRMNINRILIFRKDFALKYPVSRPSKYERSKRISFINLKDEFELLSQKYAAQLNSVDLDNHNNITKSDATNTQSDLKSLRLANACLALLPPTSSCVITSASIDPSTAVKSFFAEKPSQMYLEPYSQANINRNLISSSQHNEKSNTMGTYRVFGLHNPPEKDDPSVIDDSTPAKYTLLRSGFSVTFYDSLTTVDLDRLFELLEASFGKKLDREGYTNRLKELERTSGISIIVVGDYLGASIITLEQCKNTHPPLSPEQSIKAPYFYPYLDKFAVSPKAQGTGIADILWNKMVQLYPFCLWRSRSNNPVNPWYFARSHGHFVQPRLSGMSYSWVCFWYSYNPICSIDTTTASDFLQVPNSIPASFY